MIDIQSCVFFLVFASYLVNLERAMSAGAMFDIGEKNSMMSSTDSYSSGIMTIKMMG